MKALFNLRSSICYNEREILLSLSDAICSIGAEPGHRTEAKLTAASSQAHARDIIWVPGRNGPVKKANADTLFAANAGMLVAAYRPDSLILFTGDGCLA